MAAERMIVIMMLLMIQLVFIYKCSYLVGDLSLINILENMTKDFG